MQFETYTYTIGAHFLPAIINGDETGLEDGESRQLDAFLSCLPEGPGHWNCDDSDSFDFARCDVTDMMSAVIVCQYLIPVSEAQQ